MEGNKRTKIQKALKGGTDRIAALFFCWILAALFMAGNLGKYAGMKLFALGNKKIFLVLLLICAVFVLVCRSRTGIRLRAFMERLPYDRMVHISLAVFFLVQLFILYHIFFETGWDSGHRVIPAARLLAEGEPMEEELVHYFANYPNNLFLVNLYRAILTVNRRIGLFRDDYELMVIVVLNLAIAWWSCYLVHRVGKKWLGSPYAFAGYLIAAALVGFSPWSVICYSDPFALFFPITLTAVYSSRRIPVWLRCVLIVVGGYLGYQIKPQAIIVVIAIVMAEGLHRGCRFGETGQENGAGRIRLGGNGRRQLLSGLCISVAMIAALHIGLTHLYESEGFEINSEQQIGMTHFLMMGMNPKSKGGWNADDVTFSQSFETRKERREANLERVRERLKKYGVGGYLQLLTKKLLTNYDDGTFAWGNEGSFYLRVPNGGITAVSGRLKSVYYHDGLHFQLFATPVHIIWLFVLLMIGVHTIRLLLPHKKQETERSRKKKADRESDRIETALMLSLIGLTVFELLFEARARYLYAYVPVYVLAAMYGLRDLCRFAGAHSFSSLQQ